MTLQGPCLVSAIDEFALPHRSTDRPLRLPVSEVSGGGRGGVAVTVGGKVEGGALRIGTRVLCMPGALPATVRSLDVDGAAATLARAGDSVDVGLAGVDPSGLAPGSVICHPEWPIPLATAVEARIVVLDVQIPILHGAQVTLPPFLSTFLNLMRMKITCWSF